MAKVVLKVAKAGDPVKPANKPIDVASGKTIIDTDVDLRDRLSELATKGNTLNPDDKSAIYLALSKSLGQDRAQKIMTHAYLFNSKPEVQRLSPEEKIKSFYTVGSNDPDVQEIIGRTKNLGYGVLPGFRNSTSVLNQAVQAGTSERPVGIVDPEVRRKVMVRIGR